MLLRWFLLFSSFTFIVGCFEESPISIELDRSIHPSQQTLRLNPTEIQKALPAESDAVLVIRKSPSKSEILTPFINTLTAKQCISTLENNALLKQFGLSTDCSCDGFLATGFTFLTPDFTTYHLGAYCKTTTMDVNGIQESLKQRARTLQCTVTERSPWLILKSDQKKGVLAFAPTGDQALQCYAINTTSPNILIQNTFTHEDSQWLQKLLVPATQSNHTMLLFGLRNAPRYLEVCLPKELFLRDLFLKSQTLFVHIEENNTTYKFYAEITTANKQDAQFLFEGLIFLRMKLAQQCQSNPKFSHLTSQVHQIHINQNETTIQLNAEISAEDCLPLLNDVMQSL